jgi:hypothetical protein
MPRSTGTKDIEAHIGTIISSAASAITTAVRQEMAGEIQRLLTSRAGSGRNIAVAVPSVRVAIPKAALAAAAKKPRGGAGQKRNVPKSCIFPGCSNPSKGPRFSFLCDKHKGAAKAERKRLLAQWKSQNGAAGATSPAPKKATAKAAKAKKPAGAKRGRKKKSA